MCGWTARLEWLPNLVMSGSAPMLLACLSLGVLMVRAGILVPGCGLPRSIPLRCPVFCSAIA